MNTVFGLQIIFFSIVIIITVLFIFFVLFKTEDDIDYEKLYQFVEQQEEENLLTLNKGNKEINKIEEQILECKKKLNMKLFRK